MTKKFDRLNREFDIEMDINESESNVITADIVEAPEEQVGVKRPDRLTQTDITKDYEYTRGNLYSIIEKGQEAINGILELAQESEMPRAYEVAGQLIKSVSDATDKLMDLQKKLKEVEEEKEVKGPTTVNNALFVGSTAELSKLLKSNKAEQEELNN